MNAKYQRIDLLSTWRTSNRVTAFFFENLPSELRSKTTPGMPRRTIRMVAGHMHMLAACGFRLSASNMP
jgi:hypothetical protein